jgi:hypothetical protein
VSDCLISIKLPEPCLAGSCYDEGMTELFYALLPPNSCLHDEQIRHIACHERLPSQRSRGSPGICRFVPNSPYDQAEYARTCSNVTTTSPLSQVGGNWYRLGTRTAFRGTGRLVTAASRETRVKRSQTRSKQQQQHPSSRWTT